MAAINPPIRAFLSYTSDDSKGAGRLKIALSTLTRWDSYLELYMFEHAAITGNWKIPVSHRVDGSEIIIILMSDSWLASDGCLFEFERALPRLAVDQEKPNPGEIIFVIVNYRTTQVPEMLKDFVFTPSGLPIKSRVDEAQDAAYKEVADYLLQVIQRIEASRMPIP